MMEFNYREQYAKYNRYFKRIIEDYGRKPAVKASLELLLTFLTISFFGIFAIRPTVNNIAQLFSDINSQKQILSELNQKVSNLATAQTLWNSEQNNINLVNQSLPTKPVPDEFISQIEGLAGAKGVVLSAFTVGQTVIAGKAEKQTSSAQKLEKFQDNSFEVLITAKGTYDQLMNFLDNLENLRRIMKINSFTFGNVPSSTPTENNLLSLTVSGFVPYFGE